MNGIFNTEARAHYLKALNHWSQKEEHAANIALNAARDALLAGAHSTAFSNTHARQLMVDLTAKEFFALYGDPVTTAQPSQSDWIQHPELAAKAERHRRILGAAITETDMKRAAEHIPTISVA